MLLDRKYQYELLSVLLQGYPRYTNTSEQLREFQQRDLEKYQANMLYLQRHGLVSGALQVTHSHNSDHKAWITINELPLPNITNKGIDFIMADGGLGAILNIQTVKLHDETIKNFWQEAILQSEPQENQKGWLKEKVKSVSLAELFLLTKELVPFIEKILGNIH